MEFFAIKRLSLAGVTLASFAVGVLTTGCGNKVTGSALSGAGSAAIINGTVVADGDPVLKSTVGLYMKMKGGHASCSATLLSDKVLITAAHCLDDADKIAIIFAKAFSGVSKEAVRVGLAKTQHPLWKKDDPTGRGDLGLVEFGGGIPAGYGAADLIPPTVDMAPGQEIVITGFGIDNTKAHSGSGVLRRSTMQVIGLFSPTEVVSDGHQHSVCFGDSGGPSYVQLNDKFYLWGVASAVTSGDCNQYAIHTAIESYEDWIAAAALKLDDAVTHPAPVEPPTAPATTPAAVPGTPAAAPAAPAGTTASNIVTVVPPPATLAAELAIGLTAKSN